MCMMRQLSSECSQLAWCPIRIANQSCKQQDHLPHLCDRYLRFATPAFGFSVTTTYSPQRDPTSSFNYSEGKSERTTRQHPSNRRAYTYLFAGLAPVDSRLLFVLQVFYST